MVTRSTVTAALAVLALITVTLAAPVGSVAAQDANNTTSTPANTSETDANPWGDDRDNTSADGENGSESDGNETSEILAQLGDVTITGYEMRDDGDAVAIHMNAEEPRPVQIDKPYESIDSEGVGDVEPAILEETRLSRGENTVVVELPESEAGHQTVWVYANDLRVPITVHIDGGTPVDNLAPMSALVLGALVGLTSAGYGAWRAIRRGKGAVRRAKP
ncbi:hypothetical protein [Natrinema salinisoli]|uniref:hypothetical protein n=1 Tax=Natrinema salinisoli TaxID=2878535 RepID=UPI001CF04AAB|nr:hypothetical protein [Natrinema salinisoli]